METRYWVQKVHWLNKSRGMNFTRKPNPNSTYVRFLKYIQFCEDVGVKATRKDFVQNVIGHQKYRGWGSDQFGRLITAGIVQMVGSGNQISYKLGPNYDAWKEGKLSVIHYNGRVQHGWGVE